MVAAGFGAKAVGGGEQAGEGGGVGQTENATDGQSAEGGVGEGKLQAVLAIELREDVGERGVGKLDGLSRRRRSGCGRSGVEALGDPPREDKGGDRGEGEGDPGELLDAAVAADVVTLGGEGAGLRVVGGGCHEKSQRGVETAVAAWRAPSSAAVSARLKTATPPIQPVKPTLRPLWMTRPMVKGPPVPSLAGV